MRNIKPNKKLLDDYILLEELGSGSFGEVYLAQYKKGGYLAMKVEEKKKSVASKVYNEYKIYRKLHKEGYNMGIPKIYDFLETSEYNILVMQLLGPSLEDIFILCKRKFKIQTVFKLAEQIMDLMENLHKTGYIHRDIKPHNFLIGRNQNKSQIYITDFGLSKRYIVDRQHIKYRDGRSLIGTARYASVNMHMGLEPSRRDEMESIGYMFIYLLKGSLPWQGMRQHKDKGKGLDKVGEIKMYTSLDVLCNGLPSCFKDYLSHCKKLKFDETPNYEYLKNLFRTSINKLKIVPQYEWCQEEEPQIIDQPIRNHDH